MVSSSVPTAYEHNRIVLRWTDRDDVAHMPRKHGGICDRLARHLAKPIPRDTGSTSGSIVLRLRAETNPDDSGIESASERAGTYHPLTVRNASTFSRVGRVIGRVVRAWGVLPVCLHPSKGGRPGATPPTGKKLFR